VKAESVHVALNTFMHEAYKAHSELVSLARNLPVVYKYRTFTLSSKHVIKFTATQFTQHTVLSVVSRARLVFRTILQYSALL
jgi:hypothetical protein